MVGKDKLDGPVTIKHRISSLSWHVGSRHLTHLPNYVSISENIHQLHTTQN